MTGRALLHLAVLILTLLAPAAAFAQVVSEKPDSVAIVVYHEDSARLVMVTERRTVDLPAGPARISFRGVADRIIPQTATVEGLATGVTEQNFDYQLLTPGALLAQSHGRRITLVRTDRATGRATEVRASVISSGEGVMLDIDGRLEALNCSALPEKVVFDDLPVGYSDKPTLSVDVVSPRAERRVVTLSYLAADVGWRASYVARLQPGSRVVELTSWITLTNDSATTFADTSVQVVAGHLLLEYDTQPVEIEPLKAPPACWATNSGRILPQMPSGAENGEDDRAGSDFPGSQSINLGSMGSGRTLLLLNGVRLDPRDLGDYKLYTLPEPTTVNAYQTKQVLMFQQDEVRFQQINRLVLRTARRGPADSNLDSAEVYLRLENREADGLGIPLPAGELSLFVPGRDGQMKLVSQTQIDDTPKGAPVLIQAGENPAIQVKSTVLRDQTQGVDGMTRRSVDMEISVVNTGQSAAMLEIAEATPRYAPNLRISESSQPYILKDGQPQWNLTLAPGETRRFTYTIEWRSRP